MNFGSDWPVKAWKDIWRAGQGVGNIQDVPAAKDLISTLTREYNSARQRLLNIS